MEKVELIPQDTFVEDVAIDPDRLDELWMEQSQVFDRYAENYADLMLYRDDFMIGLTAIKSKYMKLMAEEPKKYGLKKTTDANVSVALTQIPEYVKMLREYNKINHDYNKAKDRKAALIQKKESLQNMVTLHGQGYFAGPSVPRKLESGNRLISQKSSKESVSIRRKYNLNKKNE